MVTRYFHFFFLLLLLYSFIAPGQPGSLDVSFGDEGKVIAESNWTGVNYGYICLMQPDGKILVGGGSYIPMLTYGWTLHRYQSNGLPDPSFGTDGVIGDGGIGITGHIGIGLQSDNKIIDVVYWGTECKVIRLTTDGWLDLGFGDNGEVLNNYSQPSSLEILDDDRIILVGQSYENQSWRSSVSCLDSNGNPDVSFGQDGKCMIPDTTITSLSYSTLQSDDKILVLGYIPNGSPFYGERFIIARVSKEGIIDSTFGSNGISDLQFWPDYLEPSHMITDAAENILITGTIQTNNFYHPFIMRLTPDGILDSSFNQNGVLTTNEEDPVQGWGPIAIQENKKIIVGGGTENSLLLRCFLEDGSIDSSFGNGGITKDHFAGDVTGIADLCIQADGKIVVTGITGEYYSYTQMVARYHSDVSIGMNENDAEFLSFNIPTRCMTRQSWNMALEPVMKSQCHY